MMKLQQLQAVLTSKHSPAMMEHKIYSAQEHNMQLLMSVPRTVRAEGAVVDPDGLQWRCMYCPRQTRTFLSLSA